MTLERVHVGSFAVVSDTVERVTGAPARSLEAFLADVVAVGSQARVIKHLT
ncbi:hypothetical protein [Nocardioides sp.]|uniref:hypothetical protein n=1 Tax=Nocardioides sp. TaxID=35761 RepID=UPI0027367FE0|nr:hypothetical protein [Nocardioides sp.]MDP3893078.1 hypothetical protein [Nocardioides sp.]